MNGKIQMNSKHFVGNAQTIGNSVCQTNYFLTEYLKRGILAVLADGKIDSVNAVRASVIACELIRNKALDYAVYNADSMEESFRLCAQVIRERIYKGRTPHVSLSAVWIHENHLLYRQIGDLALFCYERNELHRLTERYGEYTLNHDKDDCILLCSEGVVNTLNEASMAYILDSYEKNQDRAQAIIQAVQKKKKADQENATVLVLSQFIQ